MSFLVGPAGRGFTGVPVTINLAGRRVSDGLLPPDQRGSGYRPGSRPTRLTYEDLVARAITRADLRDDVRGINASIELIQETRGGAWPTEPVTEEFNFVDLVWHELEFREGYSFTYAVYDATAATSAAATSTRWAGAPQLTEELARATTSTSAGG